MSLSIRIMLPVFPSRKRETTYFKGLFLFEDTDIIIYITAYAKQFKNLLTQRNCDQVIYGYCNSGQSSTANQVYNEGTYLILEQNKNIYIKNLIIKNQRVNVIGNNCIIMLYDYDSIRYSETLCSSTDNFSTLQTLVHNQTQQPIKPVSYEPVFRSPYWLSSSMFTQHLINYFNLMNWLIKTVRRDRKVSIKHGNLILAVLMDVFLGYFLLQQLTHNKKELGSMLMGILENLVNLLYSLLKWLMGAPAGLKLNNAFNKMLGKYFSYHIQLWWLFLEVSGEKLETILHIYHYLGYLGFTFQAAVISDMICIATFHSYCIYVYAARLFNIQVSGLIALLRLFVGRKYNPLRGGIDSCEYTNQELFVGTVAFTILLLLLPTTAMYYIVFTLFRLMSLVVQYSLAKLICIVQSLPLYVTVLWLARSPKIAGDVLIQKIHSEEGSPLILRVKLFNKSLQELVKKFVPPVDAPKHFEWSSVLSNVFIGKQII